MEARAKYKTRQQKLLIGFLETRPGVHVTAGDVCEYFRSQGAPISQATVYRQLERLVDEGIVKKYIIDGSSPACFEYTGTDLCKDQPCFHCKCEKCGKLIHLHCEELQGIAEHLYREHSFRLNSVRTVLYGLCETCMEASSASSENSPGAAEEE